MRAIVLFPGCRYALPRAMCLLPFQGVHILISKNGFHPRRTYYDFQTWHIEVVRAVWKRGLIPLYIIMSIPAD